MSLTGNVSLLAQSSAQTVRLNDLRARLDDLSRQVATQQKSDTYGGLGTDALNIQYLNKQQPLLESYLNNITKVSTSMTMMNNAMSSIAKVGNNLVSAIQTQIHSGATTVDSIRQIAQQGLKTVEDFLNTELNGRYLFAGSDGSSPPFVDDSTLNSNFITQINAWLASGDTAALNAAVDGFSDAGLGLSAGLAASGNVTARIGDNLNIDYTLKADQAGFQNLIRGLTLMANLPYPTDADVATGSDFNDVVSHALDIVQNAVTDINKSTTQLAGKFNLLKSVQAEHQTDLDLVKTQISQITTADPTEALVKIQTLQTQLTASYQVTSITSQLSLVNYL